MNTLNAVRAFRAHLEAWLARLQKIPSPKPQTPEAPERKPKSPPIQRKIPMKGINDSALRAEYRARWKMLVEAAKREIEAAKEAVSSLSRTIGTFTDEEAIRWYWSHYNFSKLATSKDIVKAREAYRKYLLAQIKFYEGLSKLRPEQLAKQRLGGFL